jgi:phosphonate transport system substrate-binding protein
VVFIAAALLGGAVSACSDSGAEIDFSRAEASPGAARLSDARTEPLRMAVAPVLSAKATSSLYQQLADYVGAQLGRPVELVQGKTYGEINDLVKSGDVTVALVCTNPYLQGKDDFGMELLAAPEVHGELVYYSLLIVNRNAEASSLRDLRGTSFAFSDPLSNTGRLAPTYQLAKLGTNADAYFSQTIFTYSHDSSIRAVADGVVTAAAVDSLVFDYLALTEPEIAGKVKVVERWGPFGINPLVVNPHLDERTKSDLRRVFLEMSNDPEGRAILASLEIDRFVVPDDSLYDSVREMRTYLRERGLAP